MRFLNKLLVLNSFLHIIFNLFFLLIILMITDFKKQYIFNISQNTRMITVCVGGVLGFLVARKGITQIIIIYSRERLMLKTFYIICTPYKVTPGLLRSIRNASFFTYGFGLFVAPEFFNPFINCPECLECKNK